MSNFLVNVGVIPLCLTSFISYAHITMTFDVFQHNKLLGSSLLYINDDGIRTDVKFPNEHFSLIGLNNKAHYLIDLKNGDAQEMTQKASIEFAKFQMLKQGVKLETSKQIENMLAMSVDPNNDEDNNILFESTGSKYLDGYQQGEVMYRVEPVNGSKHGLSKSDIKFIQKQAFNYEILAKTSMGNFENLPIELIHIMKYQGYELFTSYEELSTGYKFILNDISKKSIPFEMFQLQRQFKIHSLDKPVQDISKSIETKISR